MRGRGVGATLSASPTMVGAITVLIAVVTVFLAYNANSGLPFVPTYNIAVEVPNAEKLVRGNEVRMGGVRIGQITSITPETDLETGELHAELALALDPDVEPLPEDSTVTVRARSALGLKYLELEPGESDEGFESGSVVPVSSSRPAGDIDDFLETFDEPTRIAAQANLVEFGNALAGRGPDINAALGELPGVLENLEPVMENLSAPDTRLERFISALAASAAEVAPVAAEQAEMFVNLDTTFTALASVAPSLSETIAETPPTFIVAEETLPTIRPFLANSAGLFNELRPGVQALTASAPTIADALEAGVDPLNDSPRLNRELAPTAQSLEDFNDNDDRSRGPRPPRADDGRVRAGDRLHRALADRLQLLEHPLHEPGERRPASAPNGDDCSAFRSSSRRPGRTTRVRLLRGPADGPTDNENFLHFNPYPNTAAPGQNPIECEAGNEPYIVGQQVIGNVPGTRARDRGPASVPAEARRQR